MVAANFEPVKRGQIYSAEARTSDGRYTRRRYVRVVGVEVKAARAKLRECTRKGNKLRKERGDFSPDLVFKTETRAPRLHSLHARPLPEGEPEAVSQTATANTDDALVARIIRTVQHYTKPGSYVGESLVLANFDGTWCPAAGETEADSERAIAAEVIDRMILAGKLERAGIHNKMIKIRVEGWRLVALNRGHQETPIRKVAAVLPRNGRTPEGKSRVRVWSHAGKSWSNPHCVRNTEIVGDAPESWPQTRSALKAISEWRLP